MRIARRCLAMVVLLALAPAVALAAKSQIASTGTILHLGPATNTYVIQADDGTTYELTNLGKKYKRDGLRVSFKAKPEGKYRPVVAGARPVRLTHIAVLSDGIKTTPKRIPPSH